jgi:hypothetical protein
MLDHAKKKVLGEGHYIAIAELFSGVADISYNNNAGTGFK